MHQLTSLLRDRRYSGFSCSFGLEGQVPIQAIVDIAVPGGQACELPPQHEHRKPSIAQYFQYSQLCGSSLGALCAPSESGGDVLASARLARSIGSNGSSIEPVSACPSSAMKLRREVRCASEREDLSNKRSSGCITFAFRESGTARVTGPDLSRRVADGRSAHRKCPPNRARRRQTAAVHHPATPARRSP